MTDHEMVVVDGNALTSWEGAAERAVRAKQERDRIVASILKEDLDYGLIPFTKKKTLYKAGAEKVADALNLWPDYTVVRFIEDWDTPRFHYVYRCILRLRGSDTAVASGIGSCNSMEKKYRYRKDGTLNDDICSQVNTLDKMAQKRAAVAATLNFGFSEYFTQDLDDMDDDQRRNTDHGDDKTPMPQPTHGDVASHDPGASTGPAGEAFTAPDGAITPKQASRAWAIANDVSKKVKRPAKDIMQSMIESYGVADVRSLPRASYNEFIAAMEAVL